MQVSVDVKYSAKYLFGSLKSLVFEKRMNFVLLKNCTVN